jgi:hypothetical protein
MEGMPMIPGITTNTASQWFAQSQITAALLHEVLTTGPQAVIVADVPARCYRVTTSDTLDPASRATFIVYGFADLGADIAALYDEYGDRFWQEHAHAVDIEVLGVMDAWLTDTLRVNPAIIRLREAMRTHGLVLNARSWFREGETVVDSYVFTDNPSLTVNTFTRAFGTSDAPLELQIWAYGAQHGFGEGTLPCDEPERSAQEIRDAVNDVLGLPNP